MAAQEGHLEVVLALLAAGANINQSDTLGHTTLMLAAFHWGGIMATSR